MFMSIIMSMLIVMSMSNVMSTSTIKVSKIIFPNAHVRITTPTT